MQVTAIVVAAGKGARMGMNINKVYAELKGKPVLAYSLQIMENAADIKQIIVVAAADEIDMATDIIKKYGISKATNVVIGGNTRFRSVAAAVPYISCTSQLVAVHDGARPLLTHEDLENVIQGASNTQGAILAAPVIDTIKEVENAAGEPCIARTMQRDRLWRAFTPQVFPMELFLEAYASLDSEVTDDASLLEAIGAKVIIVEGRGDNIKITTPMDLKLAELILQENE